jgi:hypothetical protein
MQAVRKSGFQSGTTPEVLQVQRSVLLLRNLPGEWVRCRHEVPKHGGGGFVVFRCTTLPLLFTEVAIFQVHAVVHDVSVKAVSPLHAARQQAGWPVSFVHVSCSVLH